MPLRISGKPRTAGEYAAMVIGRRGNEPIRLSDVATVDDTVEEQRSLALINGEPAVAIDITKQTKANTVGVVDAVRAAVDELRAEVPPGTEIQIVRDTSNFIRESVADVQNTLRARRPADDPDRLLLPELVALDGHHRPDAADLGHLVVHRHVLPRHDAEHR